MKTVGLGIRFHLIGLCIPKSGKKGREKTRFSKDVMAKIRGGERKVGACRELYFPGVG